MHDRHTNRERYFNEQVYTTKEYVIPFVAPVLPINTETTVLEIGCGEAGNLKPFLDLGCTCVGIDLSESKIELGKKFFEGHPHLERLTLMTDDIYDSADKLDARFDLIILRDVIEHIHDQEKFMGYMKRFLKPGGRVFFAFPPWQNPFGGHQQICRSKFLSKLPWFHLFPVFMYRGILKMFGESKATIENLLEVKETGISLERFQRILRKEQYKIDRRCFYFINPNYEVKFKLKPRIVWGFIGAIPWFRNFFTTTGYYVVSLAG